MITSMRVYHLISIFLLSACGGSGDSNSEENLTFPYIQILTNQNTQLVTKNVTLTWDSKGAAYCTASGDWLGNKGLRGTEEVEVTKIGTNLFTLLCNGPNYHKEANVEVQGYIIENKSIQQAVGNASVNRDFSIRYPQNPVENQYPLMFVFHGAGGSGEQEMNRHSEILNLIDEGKFIGIFPTGFENRWNVSGETNADDVEFFDLMIAELNNSSIFDTSNIYAIGISNGAGIINKIAKEKDLLKGIAPLISQQSEPVGEVVPGIPLSVYQVNGENDDLVPIAGGPGVAGTIFMSAKGSAENWAINFNCSMTPNEEEINWGTFEVSKFTYADCLNGVEVKYFIVKDSGHNIQFENQTDIFNQIWEFFIRTTS
jgi:poly(3-hydroxybutyrate) depolymerase